MHNTAVTDQDSKQARFVRAVLDYKRIEYEVKPIPTLFECRFIRLDQPLVILEYLEDRVRVPHLLSTDVVQRARERYLLAELERTPALAKTFEQIAAPYVCGPKLTAIDLWIATINESEVMNDRVCEVLERYLV